MHVYKKKNMHMLHMLWCLFLLFLDTELSLYLTPAAAKCNQHIFFTARTNAIQSNAFCMGWPMQPNTCRIDNSAVRDDTNFIFLSVLWTFCKKKKKVMIFCPESEGLNFLLRHQVILTSSPTALKLIFRKLSWARWDACMAQRPAGFKHCQWKFLEWLITAQLGGRERE